VGYFKENLKKLYKNNIVLKRKFSYSTYFFKKLKNLKDNKNYIKILENLHKQMRYVFKSKVKMNFRQKSMNNLRKFLKQVQ